MARNLDRRIEVLFPIEDDRVRRRMREDILAAYLGGNVKARELSCDGTYTRPKPDRAQPYVEFSAQELQRRNVC